MSVSDKESQITNDEIMAWRLQTQELNANILSQPSRVPIDLVTSSHDNSCSPLVRLESENTSDHHRAYHRYQVHRTPPENLAAIRRTDNLRSSSLPRRPPLSADALRSSDRPLSISLAFHPNPDYLRRAARLPVNIDLTREDSSSNRLTPLSFPPPSWSRRRLFESSYRPLFSIAERLASRAERTREEAPRERFFHSNILLSISEQFESEEGEEWEEGADEETMESLPCYRYERKKGQEGTNCCICLEQIENGEKVKRLPCMHFFHSKEIDCWLQKSKLCPICKAPVDTIEIQ